MESFTVDLFGPNSRSVVVISGLDYIVVVLAAAVGVHAMTKYLTKVSLLWATGLTHGQLRGPPATTSPPSSSPPAAAPPPPSPPQPSTSYLLSQR